MFRASGISICCVVVMLALAGASILAIGYVFENFSMCGSRVVKEFPSPDRRDAAIVGVIGCGATGPDIIRDDKAPRQEI
jgi:hypothetical protein